MIFFKNSPRFFISIVFAFISIFILTLLNTTFNWTEKVIIGFNIYLWTYVVLLLLMIKTSTTDKIKSLAIKQDEPPYFLITISIISAFTAIGAIAYEITKARGLHGIDKALHLMIPTSTLAGAWILIPSLFCVHYTHLYFAEKSNQKIIKFPEELSNPDYVDFLYFSVTIAAAAQTADVCVTNKDGRKLVLLQSMIAFIFNTTIVALGINVAASLLN